ncbi:MAG: hypothetical protein JW896_12455 [Deltaproteobacteria bacterium]|nr:hypothetical protein [Deltaproteobacteria bacterium]
MSLVVPACQEFVRVKLEIDSKVEVSSCRQMTGIRQPIVIVPFSFSYPHDILEKKIFQTTKKIAMSCLFVRKAGFFGGFCTM